MDGITGNAMGIQFNAHSAGRVFRVAGDEARIQTSLLELLAGFTGEIIRSEAADYCRIGSQSLGVVGEICRCPPKLASTGEHIPEDLPQTDNSVCLQAPGHWLTDLS